MEEEIGPKPLCPPYYSKQFFNRIKEVKNNTTKNIVWMSPKQWYSEIIQMDNITHTKLHPDSPLQVLPSRVGEIYPDICWNRSHRVSRQQGLSPEFKSFLF